MKRLISLAALICVGISLTPAAFSQDASTTAKAVTAKKTSGAFLNLQYEMYGGSRDTESFRDTADVSREDLYQSIGVDTGYAFGSLQLRLTADVLSGQLAGPGPYSVPREFKPNNANDERGGFVGDNFQSVLDPFNAYVEYRSIFLARLGLQTSNYGLGMVANDGNSGELFNITSGGDRSFRLLLAARPFALSSGASRFAKSINVAVGGDYVFVDDNASLLEEDQAVQGIASIFYQDINPRNPKEEKFLGLYFARRSQEDFSGETLDASAIDVSGKRGWMSDDDYWFYELAFESALLVGDTSRARTQSGRDETDILAFGTAVEAEAMIVPMQIGLKLKGGYATGDANPDDDTLFRFRFDPNYKVGLILYDHYIPAMTRRSYLRATDPTRSGEPPKGVEGLISDGAVENTFYLNPQILFGDENALLGGVSFLWARSAVPLADPFNTFAAGGTPVGINGGEGSRDLGIEVDGAVQYRREIAAGITGEVKLEYGILFPGAAFDDVNGNSAAPQNLVRGRLALMW